MGFITLPPPEVKRMCTSGGRFQSSVGVFDFQDSVVACVDRRDGLEHQVKVHVAGNCAVENRDGFIAAPVPENPERSVEVECRVVDEYERTLVQGLEEENVLRSLCTVIQTSSGDRKIPIVASHGTASWVDEEGTIPESDDAFGQISIGAHKVATMIKVSDELLQDSVFNIESYIAAEFARRIGAAEEEAFITGNGTGKPTGLLHATNGAGTGVTTTGTTIAADELFDLVHSIKSVYRKKAVFLLNDSTLKAIRKLKDGQGQYLWQPGIKEGQPDTLLNYRLVTSPFMPEISAGNKVILFGDFKSYWIADRQGRSFQRLNELFAVTGQVGFRATQRVDGRLVLAEAMKCLAVKA